MREMRSVRHFAQAWVGSRTMGCVAAIYGVVQLPLLLPLLPPTHARTAPKAGGMTVCASLRIEGGYNSKHIQNSQPEKGQKKKANLS